jgi:NAD+ diphosphatase
MKNKVDKGLWFDPAVNTPQSVDDAVYFVFHKQNILVSRDSGGWIPLDRADWLQLAPEKATEHYMGMLEGQHCFAVDLEESLAEREFTNLRNIASQNDDRLFALAGRATQLVEWFKTHQFCGLCGVPTEIHQHDRARVCPECDMHFYPRLSPSIIVLVRREEEVLLARNINWPEGFYSTLAGFVEPGESVEETLHREVFEEVGIKIRNIQYKGSQPWAFPNSLMIGYHADYDSGEFNLQEDEISDAQWFHYTELPKIPGKIAISRWLIDAWLQEMGVDTDA